MKTKSLFIIPLIALLFVGLIFSSGCVKKEAGVSENVSQMFAGGNDGLVLSFLPGAPPSEIFELSDFTISVKLDNQGEYTVPAGKAKVTLGGINTQSFSINETTRTNTGELTGKQLISGEEVPGAFEILDFNAKAPDYPGDTQLTIVASTCYPYESLGVATACIKENVFAQTTGSSEICKISGDLKVKNKGAPVHVSSIKEIPMGTNKIGFQVRVKNLGNGQVYGPDSECGNKENTVRVSASIPGIDVTCNPSDLTLVDGEALTFCTATIPENVGEYKDLLQITLQYYYSDHTSQKITIRNVPSAESA